MQKVTILLLWGFILTGCAIVGNEILTMKPIIVSKDCSNNKDIGSDNDKTIRR